MPHAHAAARELADRLIDARLVPRIWERDAGAWIPGPDESHDAARAAIVNRLGWLTSPGDMRRHLRHVAELARAVRHDRIETVYLLGMGGSSLCAEVLRSVGGEEAGWPDVIVLDTTDEATIRRAAATMHPERTLFLVASKSGTTVEVSSLERYFMEQIVQSGSASPGSHFIAITDPGTPLAARAAEQRYRDVLVNPPDIGGRFSALSLFGLVPAALMGKDLEALLDAGEAMAEGCREERHTNPGLELGAAIGAAALAGRDKLTFMLAPSLGALGLWIEQLVAESTGKAGRGVLPVVDEPAGDPRAYGSDRQFVAISTEIDAPDGRLLDDLEAAGHPVVRLSTRMDAIGAEFFRWEFATAVVGAVLGVNPFDEPNVTEAKDRTRTLLLAYRQSGRLPEEAPSGSADGVTAVAGPRVGGGTPVEVLRSAFASISPADYVALLSYLPAEPYALDGLQRIRAAVRDRFRVATTLGTGPRYLHSTGQYHKGGPDRGICLVITTDDPGETQVPGQPYSFSVLKRAQALGDLQALTAHGRRALRLHVPREAEGIAALERLVAEALA
jgi:glucose-6-phosphate isomerase